MGTPGDLAQADTQLGRNGSLGNPLLQHADQLPPERDLLPFRGGQQGTQNLMKLVRPQGRQNGRQLPERNISLGVRFGRNDSTILP